MRFKIDCASLTNGRKFTVFALFYFVFEGNFQVLGPRGDIYLEGRFNGGFFAFEIGGLIFERGAYFRNFKVTYFTCILKKMNLSLR